MRKSVKFIVMLLLGVAICSSKCKKSEEVPPVPQGENLDLGDGSTDYEIKENKTLSYPNTYNLKGFVYVTEGVTLTIEPGVIIKGDKASKGTLIIERGAKIIARGTKERPIVFTSSQAPGSRKPGDWGGIIVLGKAKNNQGVQTIEGGVRSQHGGDNDADNSGVLSYLRCEFAGIEYSTDNEINGITFGSVGYGTQLDHLQVSYSGDDSYEWFGGCVNAKYLVAFHGWDDDFDTDNGFSGKIQFGVGIRNPKIGDKSASNGFESDNDANGTIAATPHTSAIFANMTIIGPVYDPATYTNEASVNGSSVDARFQAAAHLRRHTKESIFNSLLAGYPIGIIIENSGKGDAQGNATNGDLNVTNCIVAGCVKNFQDKQVWTGGSQYDAAANSDDFGAAYFNRAGGGNRVITSLADLKLAQLNSSLSKVGVFPNAGSPLLTGADWSHAKVASGFEKVNYIGAFGPNETASSNWMSGWTNFDPQNTKY